MTEQAETKHPETGSAAERTDVTPTDAGTVHEADGGQAGAGTDATNAAEAGRSPFFALLGRTQLIHRWSLMRNTWPENVQEHSFQTAVIAQALVFIRQVYFPENTPQLDPDRVLARALYHDATEVITGDLPTPVKYHDDRLQTAYKDLEREAGDRLLNLLPEPLRACYRPYVDGTGNGEAEDETAREVRRFVKAADKLSALIKCRVELEHGNREFEAAEHHTVRRIHELELDEADYFLTHFLPYYTQALDHYRV